MTPVVPAATGLDDARRRAHLSITELHLRYLALGGSSTRGDVGAHVAAAATLSDLQHDVLVHALNERFMELAAPERLPYRVDGRPH
jgi:hypothetical protein